MPQSFHRVGNAPRFVFQISNFKSQISNRKYEQSRLAGYAIQRLNAHRATYLCEIREIRGQNLFDTPPWVAGEAQDKDFSVSNENPGRSESPTADNSRLRSETGFQMF